MNTFFFLLGIYVLARVLTAVHEDGIKEGWRRREKAEQDHSK